MIQWKGSKYKRLDSNTFRDRHSGLIYRDVKKEGNRFVGVGKVGFEGRKSHFSGYDPRKIPARLKKR